MAWSGEIRTSPSECTCVTKMVNCFAATHVNGNVTVFISQNPVIDLEIAQTAAKVFAETHNIPYCSGVFKILPPPITLLKHNNQWFPAELHEDKILLVKHYGSLPLARSNLQEAIKIAKNIAVFKQASWVSSTGSLDKPYNLKPGS